MPVPTVSIITPCYRQAHFLTSAIDSVLAQSYPAVQHVVVNDGSDDDTEAVAARYGDRIHYFAQPNRGLAAARNAGIRHAQGQYVLCLDADDELHPDAIAWLVEAMEGRDDRLCVMGYRTFGDGPEEEILPTTCPARVEERAPLGPPGRSAPWPAILPWFIHWNPCPPLCYLASRQALVETGGYYEAFRSGGCEDWDLWLSLGLRGTQLKLVPRCGGRYRRHEASMSARKERMFANRVEVLLRLHQRFLPRPDLLGPWGLELLNAEQRALLRCVARGMKGDCIKDLIQAIRTLHQHGFSLDNSVCQRLLETLLGAHTVTRLALAYYRVRYPVWYANLVNADSLE